MFTGIIQTQGQVIKKNEQGKQVHFVFAIEKKFSDLKLGESIAVNGVCLTVSRLETRAFHVDVIRETLESTNLGKLQVRDFVNLERSLKWGDPIDGHFVSGHVDGMGTLQKITCNGRNQTFTIQAPSALKRFLIPKGSIALEGVSLTIQTVQAERFTVGLVPHTLQETNLGKRKVGDKVNLEADILTRYFLSLDLDEKKGRISLENFFKNEEKYLKKSPPLSFSFLKGQGF